MLFKYSGLSSKRLFVFIPGVSGGIRTGKYANLQARAQKEGFDFLGVQYWDDGEDFGSRDLSEIVESMAKFVARYAKDYESVALVGKSIGGAFALF